MVWSVFLCMTNKQVITTIIGLNVSHIPNVMAGMEYYASQLRVTLRKFCLQSSDISNGNLKWKHAHTNTRVAQQSDHFRLFSAN